jgi:hypothetical protein
MHAEVVVTESCRQSLLDVMQKYAGGASIRDDTRLYHDLYISGDDATELFAEIHKVFGTRFDGLDFNAYFPNETEGAWSWGPARLAGWDEPKRPLIFRHLLGVVDRGEWFRPEGDETAERLGAPRAARWVARLFLAALALLLVYHGTIACFVGI